ncbi:tRNA-uridine aminocarboxypropyltransferase [Undibacterium cyanobacteriorum]|uniref:tRNA-uridine aminocarboxypropyltransferase n=1 Tax=Undibacterium cyanobacteriorum TaxID=3073561 RepID=A0ABY9RDU3_9BURK|nr:tRNA-uridine aminocarboxypropyltransferase [Undibacterium sp. 20NA77.5]WMW79334.1 tRNA-uridine aminocarboxypropyltransferase [Undibacterium sp. 20NA77.5]
MMDVPQKRAMCARCLRAASACICACVEVALPLTEVLILQHPQEACHIKSSGRLLHLCLPQSQIEVGIAFDEVTLRSWLNGGAKQSVLLYPETEDHEILKKANFEIAPSTSVYQDQPASALRLVVIDASWRQSRAMLAANPSLLQLPRISLQEVPASQYLIRQAHKADQLSSLEACAYALQRIDESFTGTTQLLNAFARFNHMQIAAGVHRLHRS